MLMLLTTGAIEARPADSCSPTSVVAIELRGPSCHERVPAHPTNQRCGELRFHYTAAISEMLVPDRTRRVMEKERDQALTDEAEEVYTAQFCSLSPRTRLNSRSLFVTRIN